MWFLLAALLFYASFFNDRASQLLLLALAVLWLLYAFREPLLRLASGVRFPSPFTGRFLFLRRFLAVLLMVAGWALSGSVALYLPFHLYNLFTGRPDGINTSTFLLVGTFGILLVIWGLQLYRTPLQAGASRDPVVVRRVVVKGSGEVDFPALEEALKKRVIGQDHAVEAVVRGLKRKAAGLTRREKPYSAMLAGPTGTGKTELAKALAEVLGRPLVRYDMNQYGQDHTVAALVGSPPGYVGSDRPGRLYEDLARYPNAVVLFDEMEKAHPAVLDPLLQLLDEGRFQELSKGLVAQAPSAILLFTTNLLAREAFEGRGDIPDHLLRGQLVQMGLRPEFVNRLDTVVAFRPFDRDTLKKIARRHLRGYLESWKRQAGLGHLEVRVDEGVYDLLLSRIDTRFGVRDLQRTIESLVADPLAEAYLAAGKRAGKLEISEDGGELVIRLG